MKQTKEKIEDIKKRKELLKRSVGSCTFKIDLNKVRDEYLYK
jgi:hypothetical protein